MRSLLRSRPASTARQRASRTGGLVPSRRPEISWIAIGLRNRMFNRFPLPALQVLFYARSEVGRFGSSALEPEHILLGIVRQSSASKWNRQARPRRRQIRTNGHRSRSSHREQCTFSIPACSGLKSQSSTMRTLCSAHYGFTLEDIIVRAWEGNCWHVDIAPELRDDARFDFLMVSWNLRLRAQRACDYAGSADTAVARRSGPGHHA